MSTLATRLGLSMEQAIAMHSVLMTSSSLTERVTQRAGYLPRPMSTQGLESMGPAVRRWTSGRPMKLQVPTLPMCARSTSRPAVRGPSAVTATRISVIRACATRTAATSMLIVWAPPTSSAQALISRSILLDPSQW